MAKKAYAGVLSDVPIYETSTTTVRFRKSSFDQFFSTDGGTIQDCDGYFDAETIDSKTYVSFYGVRYKTQTFVFAAKGDLTGVMVYTTRTSSGNTMEVWVNDVAQTVNAKGETSISVGSLAKGGTIKVRMLGYNPTGADVPHVAFCCDGVITNTTLVGTETKDAARQIRKMYCSPSGVARKVKKAYVGDESGVARQFYLA